MLPPWILCFPVAKQTSAYESSDIDIAIGDRLNLCYSSTVVTKGRGLGVVIATGMNTQVSSKCIPSWTFSHIFQIGHIAAAISGGPQKAHDEEDLPLRKRFYERLMKIVYVPRVSFGVTNCLQWSSFWYTSPD